MQGTKEFLKINWVNISNRKVLRFTFSGKLSYNTAREAILTWQKEFDSHPNEKIDMIWDCSRMTDYEPMAKAVWQKTLAKVSEQLGDIWLLTNSRIIYAGAKIMTLFTPYKLHVVKSMAEIQVQLQS